MEYSSREFQFFLDVEEFFIAGLLFQLEIAHLPFCHPRVLALAARV
jgi:hypothetical protein